MIFLLRLLTVIALINGIAISPPITEYAITPPGIQPIYTKYRYISDRKLIPIKQVSANWNLPSLSIRFGTATGSSK